MGNILQLLLHWRHPQTGATTTQVVVPGESTPAPDGIAPGVFVTAEHVEEVDGGGTSEASTASDVAPEALEALGATPATTELPHEP